MTLGSSNLADSVALILGSRDDQTVGCFCPSCALDRIRTSTCDEDKIVYVEVVSRPAKGARCIQCGIFPLALSVASALGPRSLEELEGRLWTMKGPQS